MGQMEYGIKKLSGSRRAGRNGGNSKSFSFCSVLKHRLLITICGKRKLYFIFVLVFIFLLKQNDVPGDLNSINCWPSSHGDIFNVVRENIRRENIRHKDERWSLLLLFTLYSFFRAALCISPNI